MSDQPRRVAVIDGSPQSLTAQITALLGAQGERKPTRPGPKAAIVMRSPPHVKTTPWGVAPMNRAMRRSRGR